jgi:hypothetical protein
MCIGYFLLREVDQQHTFIGPKHVAARYHLPCRVVTFSTLKNVSDFATNLISLRPVVMTLHAFETNFWTPVEF